MQNSFLSELVGSMSQGAAGDPTVAMMEAAFRHHGLSWRYLNLEVAPEDLADAVRGARAMGFRGFNLSMPHKVEVLPLLDELAESARLIGAVNCVVRRGTKLVGENTDGKGFLASLVSVIEPRGQKVVMFGAGGAARAIAVELALAGAEQLTIVNREEARGRALVTNLQEKTGAAAKFTPWDGTFAIPPDTSIVINGTSVGLGDPTALVSLDLATLQPSMIVGDVVYNPPQTRLLREAAARGCRVLDGLGMLVNQAATAFRYWTNIAPNPVIMRRALEQALAIPPSK